MQFEFNGFRINILDTPGHQDFSEDTYRVLVAADAAVMLIDAAKGVEAQTIKLFKVCRMRGIPIFTFVNKMDRAAQGPLRPDGGAGTGAGHPLLPGELAHRRGRRFPGRVPPGYPYRRICTPAATTASAWWKRRTSPWMTRMLETILDKHYRDRLMEEIALLDEAGDPFDLEAVRRGELTPMFFGSAVTNFGVEPFLERFLQYTPAASAPPERPGHDRARTEPYFSGFIFKIQANMNPAHRDRLAFMRIVSGAFEKGMEVWHSGTGKQVASSSSPSSSWPTSGKPSRRPGPGTSSACSTPVSISWGTRLSTGPKMHYENIPVFAPEHFATGCGPWTA